MKKSILIILFALLGVFSAQAYNFYVDGIYYNRISGTDDQVEVTYCTSYYNSYSGSVDIPATVEYESTTYMVTSIGYRAFSECTGLTSVTIPNSVTFIGKEAFFGCEGLTSIMIPESVTFIGELAFACCYGLTSVTIPEGVSTIGEKAFYNCTGLTSVTIPESVTSIGDNAFGGCASISSPLYNSKIFVRMPRKYSGEYAIPSGIRLIVGGAFYGCSGLTSVTIPESVTTIRNGANITNDAFYGCTGLRSVEWNAVNYWDYSYYNKDIEYYGIPFRGCGNITSITFGNQVKYIPRFLCYGFKGLTSVTIPNSVTSIGYAAFADCSSLTSVTIGEGVTSIEPFAFEYCTGLASVTIPNSVTSIGYAAFDSCTGLTSVTIPGSVTFIGSYAFEDCSGLTSVTMGGGETSIGKWAFVRCTGLTSVTMGEGVTSIGYGAFAYCSGLTSMMLPNSVTSIGDYVFYKCSGLTSVTIPESEISIGEGAFADCSGLTSVTIPDSVTSIGAYAFADCSGLTSVKWNAVSCQDLNINDSLFYGCEKLKDITFGKQVKRIPAYLCYGLNNLTSIKLPKSLDSIGKGAFQKCDYLLSVTSLSITPPNCYYDEEEPVFSVYGTLFVPRGSKIAYQTAQEWYKFTRIEELASAGTATVTVNVNDATMGTVVGGGEYELDEQAVLAAIPNQGYHFVKWDDGVTANPRILTVTEDITLTAIFAKEGDEPTANEPTGADNFRVYVHDRTIHLSEDRGTVQVYNMAGQRVYNGHATAIPVRQSGVYIVVANGQQRIKVVVR